MARFYQRISFRIWFPYALVLLVLITFVSLNYPARQARLFRANKERELRELAKTVALGVELSLNGNDFGGLKRTVDFVSGITDFEFVAILQFDSALQKEIVFATFPEETDSKALIRNEQLYVYEQYPIEINDFKGSILIAASRAKIDQMIWDLNRPIYIALPIVFLVGLGIFFLIARQITRPIRALTDSAHQIEQGKYDLSIAGIRKQDEIGELSKAFDSLRLSLINLRDRNQQLNEKLEGEVNRLSLVARETSNLVIITDREKKIEWVNDSFSKLTGYSIDEIKGKRPSIFQFEKTDPNTIAYINECLEQQIPISNVEILNRGKQGNEYWLNLNIVPIQDATGKTSGYIAVESDVTDRKAVDIALRDSELRMRQTMDAALDAIIIIDTQGLVRFWNRPAVNMFGFNKEESIGNRLSELIIPHVYREAHERGMKHYLNTGEGPVLNKTIEITGLRKNGEEFPIEISIVPIDQDGIRLFCAFIRDITTRKQQEQLRNEAQQALIRNEEELRKMNETLEQKVLENTKKNLDLSRMIVDQEKLATVGEISAGIAHDLNTPLSSIKAGTESVSYSIDSLIRQQLSVADPVLLAQALELAKPAIREIYLGGLQLRQEKGQMLALLTEYNHTLKYTEEERDQLAERFVRCRIQPAEASTISQVLRSSDPLTLLNLIQQIQTTRSLLDSILVSVDRASKVIRDVRSFIKKDAQAAQSKINLHENIAVVLNIFHYELRRDVTLDLQIDPTHTIMGYEVKLFQLWSNLIKNALDAMEGETDKQLSIRSEVLPTGVSVTVENTGPEIPQEIIGQIFRKFFTTKHQRSGTGLGLSIVKNVADEHGATVSVRSENRRTAFTVTFPNPDQNS